MVRLEARRPEPAPSDEQVAIEELEKLVEDVRDQTKFGRQVDFQENLRDVRQKRADSRKVRHLLPQSPLTDPKYVAARERYKTTKPPQDRANLTPFQKRLENNAYGTYGCSRGELNRG